MSRQLSGFKSIVIFKDQRLGMGSYGMVCKAQYDHLPCAAKLLHPIITSERNAKLFQKECQMLSVIKHPNVIRYLGTYQDGPSGTQVLFMELMEESLTSLLERSSKPLPFHTEVNLCHDIILALEYLHSNDIIHRDLSSNNVLLSEGGRTAKVTDFGMARLISTCNDTPLLTQAPGCPLYMPPEALSDPPVYTERLDVFSFGVLTIQILTLETPNPGPSKQKIKDPKYPVPIELPICDVDRRKNHINLISDTHPLRAIVLECLIYEEEKRPTAMALCQMLSTLKTSELYLDSAKPTVCVEELQEASQSTLAEVEGYREASCKMAGCSLGPPDIKECGDHSRSSQPVVVDKEQEEEEKREPFEEISVDDLRLGKEHKLEPLQINHLEDFRLGKERKSSVILNTSIITEQHVPILAKKLHAKLQLISKGIKGWGNHSQSNQPNATVAVQKPVEKESEKNNSEPIQINGVVNGVDDSRRGKDHKPEPFQLNGVDDSRLGKEHNPPVSVRTSLIAETQPPSLAEQMRAKSQLISSGSPSLYQIPASVVLSIVDRHIVKYDIGIRSVHDPAPGRVLLMVGAKGARKTELINVLTNHIYGVCIDDSFRFILDSKEEKTSWIRAYMFHKVKESPLPFSLTIVDTPFFDELLQNRKLAALIKELFSTPGPLGIDRYHGIVIVVNENSISMPMQKQIAQALHFCFGEDYSTNVFIGVTKMSSDSTDSSLVETSGWSGVPVDRINTFDISVMFNAYSTTSENTLKWKKEALKFEAFIKQIGQVEGRSLLLSTDALAEISKSEESIKNMWHRIQAGLIEISALHQVIQTQIANRDFSCPVTAPEWHTAPLTRGQMAMNCQRCRATCHFPCHALSDAERDKCCVMMSSVGLTCCECRCVASNHVISPHRYVLAERGTTGADFRKPQFQSTYGWKYGHEVQLSMVKCSVTEMITIVYCCIRHLDDIALKLNPITPVEYIDLLIQSEKQEAWPGHAIRVMCLEELKKDVRDQSAAKIKAVQKDKLSKQEEPEDERESRMQREAVRGLVQLVDVNYFR